MDLTILNPLRTIRCPYHETDAMSARPTFAQIHELVFRVKQACALLDVTRTTLHNYGEPEGISIPRASDINPNALPIRIYTPETIFQLAAWRRSKGYIKLMEPGSGPVIITVYVVKGGTGKTTTAVETAMHLQLMGFKTLTIDMDAQANASQAFGYESDIALDEAPMHGLSEEAIITSTFKDVVTPYISAVRRDRSNVALTEKLPDLIKKPFGESGPHIIAADTFLGDMEAALTVSTGARELAIRNLFDLAKTGAVASLPLNDYDVVIIDCPPSTSMTSTAAMAASDFVIAPLRMDSFAVKGLSRVVGAISELDAAFKVSPDLVILPTYYSTQLSRVSRMQTLVNKYAANLAPCVISASEEFPRTIENYLPLTLQRPTSAQSAEYRVFANFVKKKILEIAAEKKVVNAIGAKS